MSVSQTFRGLPPWAQGTIAVGALAVTGFVVYKGYKAIENYKAQKGSRTEDKAVNSDLSQLIKNGQGPTLSKSQTAGLANQLFTAMDGYGTDNKSVLAAMSLANNDADVLQIIDDFGTKEISSGFGNPEPNYKGRLPGAIVSEVPRKVNSAVNWGLLLVNPLMGIAALGNGDIGVNTINDMFAKKGITYRF